jgi:beta-glucosidase-like glycosyl hydrolase
MMNSPTPEPLDRVHRETATDIVQQLSNVEKASLCTGRTFWELQGVERFNLPSIWLTDGPHGLRKQQGDSDHIGLSDSVPAICFPTAVGLASSWNRGLLLAVGEALGQALTSNAAHCAGAISSTFQKILTYLGRWLLPGFKVFKVRV